jgi:hypothetical protein
MSGSSQNSSGQSIVIGMALSETPTGSVVLADSDNPAFSLATDGAPPRGTVSWTDSGTITRQNWAAVTGTASLLPGQAYFVRVNGQIATTGSQQIGRAVNATTLRVSIGDPQPSFSQIWPTSGRPASSVGNVGDIAVDQWLGGMWTKGPAGWSEVGRMMKPIGAIQNLPVNIVPSGQIGGWIFSGIIDGGLCS